MMTCLARIVEFLENHARHGWTEGDANTFFDICARYAIFVEETYGITSCTISLHNLLHLEEDICNFSGLDNYSCWTKERAVKRYIRQSNNHKNIEATFAHSEARRELLKLSGKEQLLPLTVHQADASKVS